MGLYDSPVVCSSSRALHFNIHLPTFTDKRSLWGKKDGKEKQKRSLLLEKKHDQGHPAGNGNSSEVLGSQLSPESKLSDTGLVFQMYICSPCLSFDPVLHYAPWRPQAHYCPSSRVLDHTSVLSCVFPILDHKAHVSILYFHNLGHCVG